MSTTPVPAPTLPVVPVRTTFFQGQTFTPLTSVWIAFFEALIQPRSSSTPELYWRGVCLQNLAVGDNIAPVLPAQAPGTCFQVQGVLRKAITQNLVVRINQNGAPLITCTLNAAAKPLTTYTWTAFATNGVLAEGDALSYDIAASDGSQDPDGVATFTLFWQ